MICGIGPGDGVGGSKGGLEVEGGGYVGGEVIGDMVDVEHCVHYACNRFSLSALRSALYLFVRRLLSCHHVQYLFTPTEASQRLSVGPWLINFRESP